MGGIKIHVTFPVPGTAWVTRRGWAGHASAKGTNEDLPKHGGWDGRRNHGAAVFTVWSPDRQHQHHLGIGPKSTHSWAHTSPTESETLGAGPVDLRFSKPFG